MNENAQLAEFERLSAFITKPGGIALLNNVWAGFGAAIHLEEFNDSLPSKYSLVCPSVDGARVTPAELRPTIKLRHSTRTEEALVHELLHLKLTLLGYARFECEVERQQLGEGILNAADHILMLPRFVALGYDEDKFLAPSMPLNETEEVITNILRAAIPSYASHDLFRSKVGNVLKSRSIKFRILNIALP